MATSVKNMQPLDKTLRNRLERTVKDARDIAEDAARAALEQLGVGDAAPFSYLSEQDRELRRRLRVHGRQLGDLRHAKTKIQEIDRLIEKVAYEHWHRMLFARFLAENDLLMYPDPEEPVAVTLEECEDLAADEGAANGWELAARFAARMLPQIFRLDSPVFQLVLPPEHQQKLDRLVGDLPWDVFTASDSLGWVYQFWQAKKKDEVNASEVKIGARELPAVTQLFTESYMVSFLLDNSLGAWWAVRRLTEAEFQNANSEAELREKASIPGVPLEYLRFAKQEDGAWTPMGGTFCGWPEQLSDLKTLDPCCGSGHFLVAAFLMLVPMRMEHDGFSAKAAVDAVLRENIHGLELDQRCVELAAFALALTAWKYPNTGGYRALPEMNLACSGLSVSLPKEEWKQLAMGKRNLRIAMDRLHDSFKDAPVLGSLLSPAKTETARLVLWDELGGALERALKQEPGEERREAAVVAQGLAKAATLLTGHYQWVITNVPYLARGKQNKRLRDFCVDHYSAAKNDLATVFLERCLEFCINGGTASIVLPQNWLFLTSYRKFREKLLKNDTWHLIARLGEGGFDSTAAAGAFVAMICLSRGNATNKSGLFGDADYGDLIRGVDVSESRTAAEKAAELLTAEVKDVEQAIQLENPDAVVSFSKFKSVDSSGNYYDSTQGLGTSDNGRFLRRFWEIPSFVNGWVLSQNAPESVSHFTGLSQTILWENGEGSLRKFAEDLRKEGRNTGWNSGEKAWGMDGISVSEMRDLHFTRYSGTPYTNTAHAVIPKSADYLPSIWCFFETGALGDAIRTHHQGLKVSNLVFTKLPFDLVHWTKVATEKYPSGLPRPYSNDPTQWIFHGHPSGSVVWDAKKRWTVHDTLRIDDTVLHVAVARLLGYRWPSELDANMDLADEQREWVSRCETLANFADDDGIVCILPVRDEASASDRLLNLLAAAFGDAWSNDVLTALLKSAGHEGKTLETWLRDKFFAQHCKLFRQRPFIWHIWDGLRDGFAALINYHKFDAKLLETLIYTYVGDWISRQKQDIASSVDGAQERLASAESLKRTLELILKGEVPCDIFVRWKPLDEQPVGWNPDLNDGVRLNIRPFLSVPDVGKKGAGVLRDKPSIRWNKDLGKDVQSAPWYHMFKGDRINDHHLTLAAKRAAREQDPA